MPSSGGGGVFLTQRLNLHLLFFTTSTTWEASPSQHTSRLIFVIYEVILSFYTARLCAQEDEDGLYSTLIAAVAKDPAHFLAILGSQ